MNYNVRRSAKKSDPFKVIVSLDMTTSFDLQQKQLDEKIEISRLMENLLYQPDAPAELKDY